VDVRLLSRSLGAGAHANARWHSEVAHWIVYHLCTFVLDADEVFVFRTCVYVGFAAALWCSLKPRRELDRDHPEHMPMSFSDAHALPRVLLYDSHRECVICLDGIDTAKPSIVLDCGHVFHADCVVHWLLQQGRCPTCRRAVAADPKPREVALLTLLVPVFYACMAAHALWRVTRACGFIAVALLIHAYRIVEAFLRTLYAWQARVREACDLRSGLALGGVHAPRVLLQPFRFVMRGGGGGGGDRLQRWSANHRAGRTGLAARQPMRQRPVAASASGSGRNRRSHLKMS